MSASTSRSIAAFACERSTNGSVRAGASVIARLPDYRAEAGATEPSAAGEPVLPSGTSARFEHTNGKASDGSCAS